MVLESTMICVDNSDYMRNGDFLPTRLQAQQDAVNLVCHSKTRANPENNVGLLTLANVEVLATLTSDVGRILSKLHQVEPNGNINLVTGIRIAHRNVEFIGSVHTFVCKENVKPFRKNHPQYTRTRSNLNLPIIGGLVYCKINTLDHAATELALKHRQGKNHKMRIVIFVGSPVETEEKELVKLAKRLKKEKVNVDVVSFGEEVSPQVPNNDLLTVFVNALNGKDGIGSHLVTVPPGPHLSDALISSPVIQGEDGMGGAGLGGSGFEFGVDPNEDPELALALRVSMEEQRQRQEEEARRAQVASATEGGTPAPEPIKEGIRAPNEEVLLERALAMSLEGGEEERIAPVAPDFATMSEEEQIAFAMQMSMQDAQDQPGTKDPALSGAGKKDTGTDKEESTPMEVEGDDDYEVMNDPEFLQSVLENLPGVDPQSEAIRQAVGSLSKDKVVKKDEDKDKDKSKK